jgi:hypothetical protein
MPFQARKSEDACSTGGIGSARPQASPAGLNKLQPVRGPLCFAPTGRVAL